MTEETKRDVALVDALTMCLHWAERDAALYEATLADATLASERIKTTMRHRVKVIRDALTDAALVGTLTSLALAEDTVNNMNKGDRSDE